MPNAKQENEKESPQIKHGHVARVCPYLQRNSSLIFS
jgi:hypothetical protein